MIEKELNKKLFTLQKAKADILCKTIQNLAVIIGKLMKEFQRLNVLLQTSPQEIVDLLTKIKLFLKLTKVVVEKASDEIRFTNLEHEKCLFNMYNIILF